MTKKYKHMMAESEFEAGMKSVLIKSEKDVTLEAISVAIESSEEGLQVDLDKEREIIEKLRRKSGIAGLGMAGTSMVNLLLIGLNLM